MSPPDRLVDWVSLVDDLYPLADASDWDATGLQAGDPDDPVHAVLVCVDVTGATLDEAVHAGADLILAHHPLLFRPLQRLTPSTAAGRLALRAARQRIALLAVHTNFDVAEVGTTDPIVKVLDLRGTRVLADPRPGPPAAVKLVTFVPRDHTSGVLEGLAAAGAGVIGEYDHCSFRVSGTGSFRPSPSARPALGERGRLNEVAEDRLEMLVPSEGLDAAVAALLAAHPYEEVAYDVY
ncbi:MAG: Nif3-like dinuclear metal center hexameric protein, partial [Actinomycetota bacterium]|nr:Nif3-like dinuclear metal center hexameric protein [Actinomycetota bacterium]